MVTRETDALPRNEGVEDPDERHAAGRMVGLLWIIGGVSGALWYLVPGAELAHWQLGLVTCGLSVIVGTASLLAPWRRMDVRWLYAAAGLSLVVIPVVVAINGGAHSPTILYLFLASVLFGYYLPTRVAIGFLAVALFIPATPLLYDADAREATYLAEIMLTAPIFAAVGLTVVFAKRQLVAWRDRALRQALLDPLTGLPNRRALTDALNACSPAKKDGPRSPALVMIDLDNFKAVNTAHGHVGGDRALRCVAELLLDSTRSEDLVARLGGDEFAIFLSRATEQDVARLAGRVLAAIRTCNDLPRAGGAPLTASVGFAMLRAQGSIDEFLDAADSELREAKAAGKDRAFARISRWQPKRARAGFRS